MVKKYADVRLLFSLIVLFIILAFTGNGLAATPVETAQIPCYVKIAGGGELRVPIDADRKADLEIRNLAEDGSVFTVIEYRNGKPRKGFHAEPATLDRKEDRKEWRFNRYFEQTPAASVVDEVRITVEKGLVAAMLGQTGDDRKDFYNFGYQYGTFTNPKRPLTVHITGDNPLGDATAGKFWMEYEAGGFSDKTSFTVKNGKTLTWDYPADKGIKGLEVDVSQGQAKVSLLQPSLHKKQASKPSTVKKIPKPKDAPKAAASKPRKRVTADSSVGKQTATSGVILNGEVPLYKGARLTKSKNRGAHATAELKADATPQEVVDFYKQTMSAKGWVESMAMVQGNKGMLMFKQSGRQLVFKIKGQGTTSTVGITIIGR